jgi:hypothetical protein
MPEQRQRAHVGNYTVSGDTAGIRYLQTLGAEASRSIFEHASEGGEVRFTSGSAHYILKTNSDFTFTVELTPNHTNLPG